MFKENPDLKYLLLILLGMWILWFFTGGPARFNKEEGPFLRPGYPFDTGESYGPNR
jgi:hypothetical protein